jgi:Abortive infection alpha
MEIMAADETEAADEHDAETKPASEHLRLAAYKDVLQPAAKDFGTEIKPLGQELGNLTVRTIRVVLAPIQAAVWSYERIEAVILPLLQQKLANRLDKLVTPPAMIAGPVIESLRFAGSNDTLREMYVNLLATSMDSDTVQYAHPAFVEFIRQMTPDECRIMRYINWQITIPLLSFHVVPHYFRPDPVTGQTGTYTAYSNLSSLGRDAKCEAPEFTAVYINNLVRLGLLEIPVLTRVKSDHLPGDPYERLLQTEDGITLVAQLKEQWKQDPTTTRSCAKITILGTMFRDACNYNK